MIEANLTYLLFEDQVAPKGFLTRDKACHALWYYLMIATKARANVGKGPESQILVVPAGQEGAALWMDKQYEQQARSVAQLYGISPEDMFKFWTPVEKEAVRLGLLVHPDIRGFTPGKQVLS